MEPHIDYLVQDCSISIANAQEILQSCTKPSIYKNNHIIWIKMTNRSYKRTSYPRCIPRTSWHLINGRFPLRLHCNVHSRKHLITCQSLQLLSCNFGTRSHLLIRSSFALPLCSHIHSDRSLEKAYCWRWEVIGYATTYYSDKQADPHGFLCCG